MFVYCTTSLRVIFVFGLLSEIKCICRELRRALGCFNCWLIGCDESKYETCVNSKVFIKEFSTVALINPTNVNENKIIILSIFTIFHRSWFEIFRASFCFSMILIGLAKLRYVLIIFTKRVCKIF